MLRGLICGAALSLSACAGTTTFTSTWKAPDAQKVDPVGKTVAAHYTVYHQGKEYGRWENGVSISTNIIEGSFAIFKRGMRGVYQHCAEKHLHRYLAEFDFRYSHRIALGVDDKERAERTLLGVVGKRLTYRRTGLGAEAAATA